MSLPLSYTNFWHSTFQISPLIVCRDRVKESVQFRGWLEGFIRPLFFAVRGCWPFDQPPGRRTTPYRLSPREYSIYSVYSIHNLRTRLAVETGTLITQSLVMMVWRLAYIRVARYRTGFPKPLARCLADWASWPTVFQVWRISLLLYNFQRIIPITTS